MQNFRRLSVWKKSLRLSLDLYDLALRLPGEHQQGLARQLRQAALQLPTRLAEGCAGEGRQQLARGIRLAIATTRRLELLLLQALEHSLVRPDVHRELAPRVREIERLLAQHLARLRNHRHTPGSAQPQLLEEEPTCTLRPSSSSASRRERSHTRSSGSAKASHPMSATA